MEGCLCEMNIFQLFRSFQDKCLPPVIQMKKAEDGDSLTTMHKFSMQLNYLPTGYGMLPHRRVSRLDLSNQNVKGRQ